MVPARDPASSRTLPRSKERVAPKPETRLSCAGLRTGKRRRSWFRCSARAGAMSGVVAIDAYFLGGALGEASHALLDGAAPVKRPPPRLPRLTANWRRLHVLALVP